VEGCLSTLEITALAIALAIDAFSVSASVGPRCRRRWSALRLAGSFGFFQAFMPLLGALVGSYLLSYVQAYDHWVAFGLLELIGVRMVFEAARPAKADEARELRQSDPSVGLSLLGLSVATSIDAFGAGMSMRIMGANFWLACPLIGSVTAGLSFVGTRLGATLGKYVGRKAELVGGLVLIGLGIRMLRM
jgi:putative Mn2+ efflux pump MntP